GADVILQERPELLAERVIGDVRAAEVLLALVLRQLRARLEVLAQQTVLDRTGSDVRRHGNFLLRSRLETQEPGVSPDEPSENQPPEQTPEPISPDSPGRYEPRAGDSLREIAGGCRTLRSLPRRRVRAPPPPLFRRRPAP